MKRILVLLLFPLSLFAQKDIPQQLDKFMQAFTEVRGFSGSVLVMKQGKVMLRKGYGLADREWNIPNTPETKFRIGSITKQFTATCILQLAEENKLSVEDKLSKYYPDYPNGDKITIHMLLTHTSGIANYTAIPGFEKVATLTWSNDSMINYFKNRPVSFQPGNGWNYSNSGFFLLGCIIEKVNGQSYNDYLRSHILDKIGMSNSGCDRMDSVLALRARGYKVNKKQTYNADVISLAWPFSAGVIYSTVDDLYKWDRALYNNAVLTDSSRKKMFTPYKHDYGYGVDVDSFENHPRIWHNGGIPGFVANLSRFPADDITTIVLSNNESNADFIAIGLADIVFGIPIEAPYVHKAVKIDPALLPRYVGKYNGGLIIEVIRKGDKLYRHRDGTPDVELIPESNTKFFYGDESDRQLEFEVDKNGVVTKIWFSNNGQRGELKKMQ